MATENEVVIALEHNSLALEEIHAPESSAEPRPEIEQPTLASADGGKAAWLMLASCCVIQLPVWGVLDLQSKLSL